MSFNGGSLPPWQLRDNFGMTAHQRHIDRTNQLSAISPAGGDTQIMGSPSGTGILIRQPPPGLRGTFPVLVEKDGGANGTKTTPATYTYTVRTLDSATTLGAAVVLIRPRPNGTVTYQTGVAGYGLAFYDGSTLKLWDAGEIPGTGTC